MLESKPRTARLEARITREMQALLKHAAELQGQTVTDFVVGAARDAATRVIEETSVIRLGAAQQERIARALIDPPAPNDALRRAFERRDALLADDARREG